MRLEEAMLQGQVLSLNSAYLAMTADIITHRFHGEHFDYLGIRDFELVIEEAFLGVSSVFNFAKFFPGVVNSFKGLPVQIFRLSQPSVAKLLTVQRGMKHNLLTLPHKENTTGGKSKSVIVEALADPNIPAEEREIDRLLDEATVSLFAGTETTTRALSVTMFHLLNNKSHMRKLCDELKTLPAMQDNAYSLSQLEPLPF